MPTIWFQNQFVSGGDFAENFRTRLPATELSLLFLALIKRWLPESFFQCWTKAFIYQPESCTTNQHWFLHSLPTVWPWVHFTWSAVNRLKAPQLQLALRGWGRQWHWWICILQRAMVFASCLPWSIQKDYDRNLVGRDLHFQDPSADFAACCKPAKNKTSSIAPNTE